MKLTELSIGQMATITNVGGQGALRQHFLDMGLIPGVDVSLVKFAPMGDPMELRISTYTLTIRLADAENIEIKDPRPAKLSVYRQQKVEKDIPHPRLGEQYDTHDYKVEHKGHEVNKGKLTFALVGNQNCGKTTLFNQLTGSNQHVGNFPGVTVERKSGAIKGHPDTEVVDLPGIYSLSPYTNEEIVSRRFVLEQKPTAIINIVDATNIERNLYLTMQLLELDIPVILALNMMDEMTGNGGAIRINEMERWLQIPVVPISAAKNQGIEELIDHAIHIARYDEKPARKDFCDPNDHDGAVHRAIHGIMSLIEDHAQHAGIPIRFAASKLIENDQRVEEALDLTENEKEIIEKIIVQMERERGMDRGAAMADMRFAFIDKLCQETVITPSESKEHQRSTVLDRFFTGKWTAIPAFIGVMGLVFWLTFNVIGLFFQNLLAAGIGYLTQWIDHWLTINQVSAPVHSLIVDAICNGVGTVISFVPIIVVLYFFLSLLEDSGYMARVAFVMDKILRNFGLSGRSIVPMLIGFGCSVPAILSVRTLPSDRDRKMTQMLIPFMSCSAKMPIYALFVHLFFPTYGALVMVGLYVLGIVMAILIAFFTKNHVFQGEAVPFVMELPNYRMPGAKSVLMLMWDKAKDFLQRAFTVIFVGTIVVWFLQNFNFSLHMVEDSSQSILAAVAGLIAPVFVPLGFGNWRMVTALISGFLAKESVVSMLTVLYGSTQLIQRSISGLAALSFLVFCLLYTPCIASIATVKNESGTKSAVNMVLFQCVIAWIMAFLVYHIGLLF
ncbi:ferrous iron transport protein B [Absicoccus intestinalis]|uniref:Ferrous iron transport protein B n=1 Tax=Absicoccus intestinalis TaxID=2926319 RepID=A0ABU4WKD2_9FIRM|nr:ferrous iron transport protein B [Absicoccus sp. CLA-KB-P134]MDX8417002.1 ferrous iron transport protein B [Absicoccus sp. CLA-KB-P134]